MYSFGIIIWFDTTKGFGIIKTRELEEYFLHHSELEFSKFDVEEEAAVSFCKGVKNGKKVALRCSPVTLSEHFILSLKINPLIADFTIYKNTSFKTVKFLSQLVYYMCKRSTIIEIEKYFKLGFNKYYYQGWSYENIYDYIVLTQLLARRFKSTVLKNTFIELKEKLVEYYKRNMSQYDEFRVWEIRIQRIGFTQNKELSLGIDEEILMKHVESIDLSLIKYLKQYKISNSNYEKIVSPYFENKINDLGQFEASFEVYSFISSDLKNSLFDKFNNSISSKLKFKFWEEKKYYFDIKENKINKWNYNYDSHPIEKFVLFDNLSLLVSIRPTAF